MEDEDDLHVCLSCQITVVGLQNYVHHRKVECAARKANVKCAASAPSGSDIPVSATHTSPTAFPISSGQGAVTTDAASKLGQKVEATTSITTCLGALLPANTDHNKTPQPAPSSLGQSSQSTTVRFSKPSELVSSGLGQSSAPVTSSYELPSAAAASSNNAPAASGHTNFSLSNLIKSLSSSERDAINALTHSNLFDEQTPSQEMAINISFPGKLPVRSDAVSNTQVSFEIPPSLEEEGNIPAQANISQDGDGLSLDVSDAMASMVAGLSPGSARNLVDPSIVLYEHDDTAQKDPALNDFFSSLELQSKAPDSSKAGSKEDRLDHHKALRISNILNELAFSSDSEDFFPEDGANAVSDKDAHPPDSHTGGKWGPGHTRRTATGGKQVPGLAKKQSIGGKWKPSGKLEAMRAAKARAMDSSKPRRCARLRGKPRRHWSSDEDAEMENDNDDYVPPVAGKGKGKSWSTLVEKVKKTMDFPEKYEDSEEEVGPDPSPEAEDVNNPADVTSTAVEGTYFCRVCNRTLTSQQSYDRHCSTTYHKKHVGSKEVPAVMLPGQVKEEEPIECTICLKSFNYKYNFARHLASTYHLKRARMCSTSLLLDESCQVLLLRQSRFQCLVCNFFTTREEYLYQHMLLPAHETKCSTLVGPLLCVRCKLTSKSNPEMLEHMKSDPHKETMEQAKRPCIIKESRNKLKCDHCSLQLHSATALVQHLKSCLKPKDGKSHVRTPGGKHLCPHCEHQFATSYLLERHVIRKHTNERPFSCDICNRSFADKYALKDHMNTEYHRKQVEIHESKSTTRSAQEPKKIRVQGVQLFKCRHCDYKVKNYRDLRGHYMSNHSGEMIRCEPCGVSFVSDTMYNAHTTSLRHQKQVKMAAENPEACSCIKCGTVFASKQKLVLHELGHKVNNFGSESFADSDLSRVLKGVNPRHHDFVRSIRHENIKTMVKCPDCPRKMNKVNLIPHLRMKHDGHAPYKCSICVKSFFNAPTLKVHMERHLKIRDFKCETCGKLFYRMSHLRNHMESVHASKDAPPNHVCSICSKTFTNRAVALAHERNHTRSYKCQYSPCRYTFRSRTELEAHHNTHTDNRPFLCDECGYTAHSKRQLGYHRRRHLGIRNYHCDYCEYKGSTKAHLKRHMRIHVGAKPYQCPYCTYMCNTLDNLGKHVQTLKHKGLPLYPCRMCKFGARTSKEFRDHLYNEHSIEDSQVGVVSTYIGIYNEKWDPAEVPEGALAIPVKERRSQVNNLESNSLTPNQAHKRQVADAGQEPPDVSYKKLKPQKSAVPDIALVIKEIAEERGAQPVPRKHRRKPRILRQSKSTQNSVPIIDYVLQPVTVIAGNTDLSTPKLEAVSDDMPMEVVAWSEEGQASEAPSVSEEDSKQNIETLQPVTVFTNGAITSFTTCQTPAAVSDISYLESKTVYHPSDVSTPFQPPGSMYPVTTTSYHPPDPYHEVTQITKVVPVPQQPQEMHVVWIDSEATGDMQPQALPLSLVDTPYITDDTQAPTDVASCVEVSISSM